jgi:hypothetical protein
MNKIPGTASRLSSSGNGNGKNLRTIITATVVGCFITGLITWSIATAIATGAAREQIMQNKQDIAVNRQSLATICEDIREIKADLKELLKRE